MQIQSTIPCPRRSEKNWTFTGAYHTSDIDSSFLSSVSCMQEVDPAQVNMVMEVYRDGKRRLPPADKISRGDRALATAAAVAAGSVSAASLVGAGLNAACLPQAGFLGALGVGLACVAAGLWGVRSQPVYEEKPARSPWHQEPLWEKTRTLELTASPSRVKTRLDSPELACHPLEAPKPETLGARFAENLGSFPSKYSAVVLGGHGMGYKSWSKYSLDEVAQILESARQGVGGRKIDLVFFDSCLMANLEGLRKVAPHARYAVASEEIVFTSDRQWELALNDLGGAGAEPRQLGEKLVKAMGGHNELVTLSLIDLEKLEPLAQSVERLAEKLQLNPGLAEKALQVHAFGSFESTRWQVFGDLGQVLEGLQSEGACPEQVAECQRALGEAVITHKDRAGYDFSRGLSIQIPTHRFPEERYSKQTGMRQWGRLLSQVPPEGRPEERHLYKPGKAL